MPLNKLQIKAQVLKFIAPLRDINKADDFLVEETLAKLRDMQEGDSDFISRILIKEADAKDQRTATIFLYLAENISPDSFVGHILNELNSPKVSDEQKMFFLNILSGLGITFMPEDMGNYLKDPDEAINSETSRFLDAAKVDPEARIDFLDFYFASPETDKKELIDSVLSDFSGDRLVNILSPLILTIDDEDLVLYCLDIIEKSKSLLAIKPLKYLEKIQNSPKISKKASKILRKMQLSGFYTEEKYNQYNKELMSDFEEPKCIISTPDGNSNFTIVISRQNKQGLYYILFAAVNATLGPFSCFGFSSITKNEYDTVCKRFFSEYEKIYIPPPEAKKLLSELALKRIEINKIIPYEYFCWERIFDDVVETEKSLQDILKENLKPVKLNKQISDELETSKYVANWFYRYSKSNVAFSKYMDRVLLLTTDNIEEVENIVNECAANKEIMLKIATRLQYLSYCLLRGEKKDLAQKYYSLLYDEEWFGYFMKVVIQKSIYEHMLNLKTPKKKTGPFLTNAESNNEKAVKMAEVFINYIEKNWIEDD